MRVSNSIYAEPLPPRRKHMHSSFIHPAFSKKGLEFPPPVWSAGRPDEAVDARAPCKVFSREGLPSGPVDLYVVPATVKFPKEPMPLLYFPSWNSVAVGGRTRASLDVLPPPGGGACACPVPRGTLFPSSPACNLIRPFPPLLGRVATVQRARAPSVRRRGASNPVFSGSRLGPRLATLTTRMVS